MTHAELALVPYNEAPASASEVEVPDVDLRNELSSETPEPEAAVSFDDSPHAAPYAAPVDVLSEVDDPATQELVLAGAALSRPAPPDELEPTKVEVEDGEPAQADFGEPPEAAATAPSDADVGLDALLLAAGRRTSRGRRRCCRSSKRWTKATPSPPSEPQARSR